MRALTIIIPCYNCSATLEEAVASCFRQNLVDFEIVLVDDASTDSTRAVMKSLAAKHPEVKAFYHDKNKGGGATRNTAVEHASNEVIFCLDSDDMLGDGTLGKMLALLEAKDCDGIGIERSIKFRGSNVKDVQVVHSFMRPGQEVRLSDLLEHEGYCSLYSTFMFTKKAFIKSGGYPTNHGFDTQGFAWRFLAAGNVAYTCPGAEYLHRVNFNQSYYLREANGGRANYNWFEILDGNFDLLPVKAQSIVLFFDYRDISRNVFDEVKSAADKLVPRNVVAVAPKGILGEYLEGNKALHQGNLDEAERNFLLANRQKYSNIIREKLYLIKLLKSGLGEKEVRSAIDAHRKYVKPRSLLGLGYRLRRKILNNPTLKSVSLSVLHGWQDIASRLHAKHAPSLIWNWLSLKAEKIVRYRFPSNNCPKEVEIIDLVIPTIPKDQELLDTYLKYMRMNLCEKIANVYIVTPKDAGIEKFCTDRGINFIDERSVLGYGKEAIEYSVNGQNRSGWLFQQMLKLSGEKFVKSARYVIADSDTLLIRKHNFIENGKSVFVENSEWQEPYFRSFERLFGYEAPSRRSLTSHMMIFTCEYLKEMKAEIEKRHGKAWDQAYIESTDRKSSSGISDYDTYANWMLYRHPKESATKPFYNGSFSRKRLGEVESIVRDNAHRYASISFHSYNG